MKGQSEMIGLLIIVILIIFIGLVFLRFSLSEKSQLPELRQNIQTSNLLQSILKYSTNEGTVRELIVKCVKTNECGTLENEVKGILDSSVEVNMKYDFRVYSKENGDKEILKIGGCDKGIASNSQIAMEGFYLEARLRLCK